MCIARSVGLGGKNNRNDVKRVQLLLNLNRARIGFAPALTVDGGFGTLSLTALSAFQRIVMQTEPRTLIEAGDPILDALKAAAPGGFVPEKLQAIMIEADTSQIDKYFQPLVDGMAANGIDTPLRTAHFLAQLGHESGDLRFAQELADGTAYEGRADLGNTVPGDGPKFKGRGLIQLTGRANYDRYGKARGRDFVTGDNPRLIATDPNLAVDVACWFWATRELSALADQDRFETITRRINGGTNGLADRKAHLDQAKWFLL